MKKVYQKCLWISYITVGIAVFFFSLAVIVGTIFLWFINKDLSFNWFMSLLSFIMLIFLCLEIREFMPSHWQDKRKEFREEIEMKSSDWMEHTWLPLKRKSKRKEFWILQLWPLGKLCSYLARFILDLIIYSIVVFGTAYYLLNDPNRIAASDIFTVLMTLIFVMLLSLMTFVHFVNGHMYLFEVGIILFLVGYVSTKLIKRSIEKEIEIDLIPTLFGYEYYVDFGRYDELINTGIVHTSIYEATVKGIRTTLKDGQESKTIDRRKEVYNFYEVEASLRYGIGKLSLDGRNIPQNKPYIGWKSDALEVSKKLSMEEDELQ